MGRNSLSGAVNQHDKFIPFFGQEMQAYATHLDVKHKPNIFFLAPPNDHILSFGEDITISH
jgi:hypothetical protein